MKILIVDDEQVSRKKMERIMRHYGDCHTVDNGTAAIKAYTEALLTREHFGLITLDVSMPDMGGTEVLTMIRTVERKNAIPEQEQVKILMVTSHADHETVVASIQGGCNDFILKPFSLARVTQKLNKMGLFTGLEPLPASGK